MGWQEDIRRDVDAFSADAGVLIEDYRSGERFDHEPDRKFYSASLIKLPVLWTLFKQAFEGRLDLRERHVISEEEKVPGGLLHRWTSGSDMILEDLALLMVSVSDNSAANILIERLGISEINATISELGLHGTVLGRKMLDFEAKKEGLDNYTTPADVALMYRHMLDGKLLPSQDCRRMLEMLSLQKLQSKLPAEIPVDDVDDVEVFLAHKTGELPGVEHDCGVFFYESESPVITVVMTEHLDNRKEGMDLCSRIGLKIYDRFNES